MRKSFDMLLVNSFGKRQRIPFDPALENGLALIRTHLEKVGYIVKVVDEERVPSLEKGVPRWCVKLLQLLVKLQLIAIRKGSKIGALLLILLAWPLHAISLYGRKIFMNKLIENIVRQIKHYNIPVLGIKVWYGDAFTWSKQLAMRVRLECPGTVTIIGGPQVRVYGEHVLASGEFDLAIMGPGEDILADLLFLRRQVRSRQEFLSRVLKRFPSTPIIKHGGYGKEGSSNNTFAQNLTIPVYQVEDLEGKILFHTIVDGYGCTWGKCNFCSHTRYSGSFHRRPVEEIVQEMRTMLKSGIAFFRFSSSEVPLEHGKQIARVILEQGLTVNYSMFLRSSKSPKQMYEAMRLMIRSGLRAVYMGGETGHDLINKLIMNKGVCKEDIVATIKSIKQAAHDEGIPCRIGLSLIYPCPLVEGVTMDDVYRENIDLIMRTTPDTVIINPPGAFPGTNWFEEAERYGFSIGEDYVQTIMQYEYSIYKPAEFWEKIDYSLQGATALDLLRETGRLRKAVTGMGIPTDISDEYLMMTEAIGYKSSLDLMRFKEKSLIDIMTGSTSYTREIVEKINNHSRYLANLNASLLEEEVQNQDFIYKNQAFLA